MHRITFISKIFLAAILLLFVIFMSGCLFQQHPANQSSNMSPEISVTNTSQNETMRSIHIAQPLWKYTYPSGDWVQTVSVDRLGNAIIVGTRFSDLYYFNRTGMVVWDNEGISNSEAISTIRGNQDRHYGLSGVGVSADGKYIGIVSASGQNSYYYRNSTPVVNNEWATVYSKGQNVAISDDGRYYVAGIGYGNNNNVLFYDLLHLNPHFYRGWTNHETWHYTTYNSISDSGLTPVVSDPHDPVGVHVAISADGQYVAAVSEDSRVYYFNQSGSLLWNNITGRSLENVAMSADGKYIAVASRDHNIYYYDATGTRSWNYSTGSIVKSVAVNRDGNYIAAGSDDSHVYLFDRNGTLLWEYATGGPVESVSISRNGQTIAAGSDDHLVYCFNPTGDLLWKYTTGDKVRSVSVSGDGEYVAAGSWDGNVYFFNRRGSDIG